MLILRGQNQRFETLIQNANPKRRSREYCLCFPREEDDFVSMHCALFEAIVRAQVNRKGVYMTSFKRGYGTAKKKRPGYLVGNLVATNWPIEKALHAIGYNQIPTIAQLVRAFHFGCSVYVILRSCFHQNQRFALTTIVNAHFLGCVHAYFARAESAFWNADSKRRSKMPFTGVLFMLPSRRRRFREHALRIVRGYCSSSSEPERRLYDVI